MNMMPLLVWGIHFKIFSSFGCSLLWFPQFFMSSRHLHLKTTHLGVSKLCWMRKTIALVSSSFFVFDRNHLEISRGTTKGPLGDKSSKMWIFINCFLRHSNVNGNVLVGLFSILELYRHFLVILWRNGKLPGCGCVLFHHISIFAI